MNRFKNYLDSQRLAKQFLVSANEFQVKGELHQAVKMLAGAVREQMTACNNLASLQFERKRKR